jgi:UDP-glucuronate decarboxylase
MHPNDGRVVSNFIIQALNNEPITIYGAGNQTRSFCYVDDLIDGLMKLMDADDDAILPINLGNPNEISIIVLAEMIIELIGSKSVIRFEPLPEDDPARRKPDISRARKVLDWEPTVPLKDGLLRTIGYFDGSLRGDKRPIALSVASG